jgi:hypothetical protein
MLVRISSRLSGRQSGARQQSSCSHRAFRSTTGGERKSGSQGWLVI